MKVIFFASSVSPQTGGEITNFKLYQYIKGKGIEAEFIPSSGLIKKASVKPNRLLRFRCLIRIGEMVSFCKRYWEKRGIIFIDYYLIRKTHLYLLIQKYFFFSNIIVYVHHFDHYKSSEEGTYNKKIKIWKERLLFSFIDKILTNSEYTKNEIISLGVQSEKIEMLNPGIDASNFKIKRRSPINKKLVFNLLFVGNCMPRKGIKYLIEAVKDLNKYRVILNIVGNTGKDPKYYDSLVSFVTENRLTDKVNFCGRVNRGKLLEFYSNADIFILPSLWEGFGIVLLEAMYYRLPIIASNISAMPELVKNGENGLLVPPANSEALATAISRLIDNPSLRKELGERGYQKVINSYSWEQTGEKFYQIIKGLLFVK